VSLLLLRTLAKEIDLNSCGRLFIGHLLSAEVLFTVYLCLENETTTDCTCTSTGDILVTQNAVQIDWKLVSGYMAKQVVTDYYTYKSASDDRLICIFKYVYIIAIVSHFLREPEQPVLPESAELFHSRPCDNVFYCMCSCN